MSATLLAEAVTLPPGGDGPLPPDCPDLVEQLRQRIVDFEMLARCAVHLLELVPRTDSPAAERALRRLGRMVEYIATAAMGAADYAEAAAAAAVRGTRPGNDV